MRYWSREAEARRSPYGRYGPSRKYVSFEPDNGGFNNVRMAFEAVAVFAHATGRTLVVPPMQRLYLLKQTHSKNPKAYHSVGDFVDLGALASAVEVVDSVEFVRREREGLLAGEDADEILRLAEEATRTGERGPRRRWREWQRRAALTPAWDPMREAVIFGACEEADPPWRLATTESFVGPKRRARRIDQATAGAPWIHFAANASFGYRIFTHWYTFFLFADGPTDAYYKRFARDRLRYRDEIVCAAGRVVRRLGGPYSAVHVRRGELQYVSVRLDPDLWADALAQWLEPGERLFVLSDETSRDWFRPIADRFRLLFLDDFDEVPLDDPNARGMVEQLVAANARTFTGTFFSTFSAFVARLRAYYGRNPASFYYAAPPEKRFVMHDPSLHIHFPYFNREWPLAWNAIDLRPPRPSRRDPNLTALPAHLPYADLPRQRHRYPSKQVDAAKRAEETRRRRDKLPSAS